MDGGGPRKEYFRLLCQSIKDQSGVFFVNNDIVNFRPNVSLFHERRFHLVGLMVSTSILHGGLAFPFFPKVIYDYMARDHIPVDCSVSDVANASTLKIIYLVSNFHIVAFNCLYASKKQTHWAIAKCNYNSLQAVTLYNNIM